MMGRLSAPKHGALPANSVSGTQSLPSESAESGGK